MSTDLRHLRIVVTAADCGSFSSAAMQLNTEISAVSRAVRDVEDALGVAIFERLPRGVRLTKAGERYVASARDILARVAQAEQEARLANGDGEAALSLGFVWPLTCRPIADLLRRFAGENAGVMLNVAEDGRDALLARVRSGELHAALLATDPAPFAPLKTQDDLDSVALWRERLVVAVPRFATASQLRWSDLADRWLLCRPQDDWRRFVAHVERAGGPTLQFVEQDVSGEGLLALVGAGLGWALLPGSLPVPNEIPIQVLPVADEGAILQAELVWRRQIQNPALTRFLALGRERFDSDQSVAPSQTLDLSP